jgi:hypothetical protein
MAWGVGWIRRIFGKMIEHFKLVAVLRVGGNILQIGGKFKKMRS